MKRFSVRDCWGIHHERGMRHRSFYDSCEEEGSNPGRSCIGDGGTPTGMQFRVFEFGFYERVFSWADHSRSDSGADYSVSTPLSSLMDGVTVTSEFNDTSTSGTDIIRMNADDESYLGFVESRHSELGSGRLSPNN